MPGSTSKILKSFKPDSEKYRLNDLQKLILLIVDLNKKLRLLFKK